MKAIWGLITITLLAACGQAKTPNAGSFEAGLQALCGQSYAGQVVSDDPQDADWRSETLIMHVKDCAPGAYRIPLSVGEDRSRTWVLTTTGSDGSWELRHEHRHEDGSFDALTAYGGFARTGLDATRQEFPTDQSTRDLFDRENIPVSKPNVWAVEVSDDQFAYELRREGRFFRAEFDLIAEPVETPPPHWGADPALTP